MEKILIVDDDANFLSSLTAKFAVGEYEVDHASTGQEALEHIFEHHPDFVVLDLNLPDIQGLEIMANSKEDVKAKNTKFVVCTNYGTKERRKESKALGAYAFFEKADYTLDELVEEIKKTISNLSKK